MAEASAPGSAPDIVSVEMIEFGKAGTEARTAVPATRQTPGADAAGGRARENGPGTVIAAPGPVLHRPRTGAPPTDP